VTASEITQRLFAAFHMYRPDEAALGRSIQHFAGQGLLRAIGGPHTGRGRERRFKRDEILRAAILYQMGKFNVSIGTMKLMMQEVDNEISAVSPGHDIIHMLDKSLNECFVWSTWGYPRTYRLAFSVRNPAPLEALYPRLSIDARAWRLALNL
jgi:hypothetical protein